MNKRWLLKTTKADLDEISKRAFISKPIAKILANRNIVEIDEIEKFKKSSMEDLFDPFLMADMDTGTEIIFNAIKNSKNIVVYGDYDVDGVSATVILFKAIEKVGGKVSFFIPDREKDGYGLNMNSIKELKDKGADVVITCDNGISAMEEVKYALELGLEIVITDHHEMPFVENKLGEREYRIPGAHAVINPKRNDCNYPFKLLCGAAIAFKFSIALFIKMGIDYKFAYEYIQFAGIATICDVVDLINENRIIAKNALKQITKTSNIGLMAIKKHTKLNDKEISSYMVGFVIGPCINASGRLETAKIAVELLITNNIALADKLAGELVELNTRRQEMTKNSLDKVIKKIENSSIKDDKVIVVFDETVHESIAGIVAGRVRENYNLPTIVLTNGKEMVKGSGRSIEEYNMFEELLKCKDLLGKFGGHPMAAGVNLEYKNVEEFRKMLNKNFSIEDENLIPKVYIDYAMHIGEVTDELIYDIEMLEPFGKGNSNPAFADKGIMVNKAYSLGKDGNILKMELLDKSLNKTIEGIAFGTCDEFRKEIIDKFGEGYGTLTPYKTYNIINLPKNLVVDIIYKPEFNEFNGNKSINLKITDIRF